MLLDTGRWPAGDPKAFEDLVTVHLVQVWCPETSTFW